MSRNDLTDFEWRVIEPLLPNKPRGVRAWMTVASSTASSGYCDPAHRGATCPSATARAPPATNASCDGERQASATPHGRHHCRTRRRHPDDRQHLCSRPSARCDGERRCRSLSRSITRRAYDQDPRRRRAGSPDPARPDRCATHDEQIADTLLDHFGPRTIMLADTAYAADRFRECIYDQGATPNIPPKRNRQ